MHCRECKKKFPEEGSSLCHDCNRIDPFPKAGEKKKPVRSSTDFYRCRCGRMWSAQPTPGRPGYGYQRICDGCMRKTGDCNCRPLGIENARIARA